MLLVRKNAILTCPYQRVSLVIKQVIHKKIKKSINFRDNKLTRLFQSLRKCNDDDNMRENTGRMKLTLSFASRARNIQNKSQLSEVSERRVLFVMQQWNLFNMLS